jgi:hypothetical protein
MGDSRLASTEAKGAQLVTPGPGLHTFEMQNQIA